MRHVTIPNCPNCGSDSSSIFAWETMKWHCFDCNANGTLSVEYTVTQGSDPEQSELTPQ